MASCQCLSISKYVKLLKVVLMVMLLSYTVSLNLWAPFLIFRLFKRLQCGIATYKSFIIFYHFDSKMAFWWHIHSWLLTLANFHFTQFLLAIILTITPLYLYTSISIVLFLGHNFNVYPCNYFKYVILLADVNLFFME